jgi:RNA polymerase sigma-70 factor (ECF subfamily)
MGSQDDNSWCEGLYKKKASELLLYGRALGLSHFESEDVLQETFKTLLRLSEAPNRPEHYCVRVFRNQTLNYRRGLWRRISREFESRGWFEPGSAQNPREQAAMVCLERLPVEQREAIVLKIWHRLTFDDIGQVTGVSPHTAAGRYRYGIEKLRLNLNTTSDESYEILEQSLTTVDTARPIAAIGI